MKDMQVYLEKPRTEAAECELVSSLATNPAKRVLFTKLAEHHRSQAAEVEKALLDSQQQFAGTS